MADLVAPIDVSFGDIPMLERGDNLVGLNVPNNPVYL